MYAFLLLNTFKHATSHWLSLLEQTEFKEGKNIWQKEAVLNSVFFFLCELKMQLHNVKQYILN